MRRRTTALRQLLKSKPKTSIWFPKKTKKITRKPDFDKSEELEADIEVKVFDVMPERGDDDKSGKGVSQLLAEIETLDSMIDRRRVGLLDLQAMKEEMEAKEREMEWKMSEPPGVENEFADLRLLEMNL
ncbi:hypothetical protein C1H46_039533 [Malus baccata]|uniref:Uncharacterized protein n=1 Tax=Malus baccata TaxID=106549 RepID=A0A540KL64_MALBA|nr:hypothetical protein C1H46_039533 [Malus baccata]